MLREIRELISRTIDDTRSLVCELYPQVLRDLGLRAALEWLIQRTRDAYGLDCIAEITSVPQSLPAEVAETIFHTVRELLINAAKHAQAAHAKLIFRGYERQLFIQIADDGKGFDAPHLSAANPRCGGFGLLSVRERLRGIGGSMVIDSAPGQGTKIILIVPKTFARQAD
jgi:signal transduction histidine kinase